MQKKLAKLDKILLSFREDTFSMEWEKALKRVERKLNKHFKKGEEEC